MFSIVIPTYNRRPFLQRAFSSILQQTFENWELILVDDGSTDGTEEWIHKFIEAITPPVSTKIRYIKTSNNGVSKARNLGVSLASKPWIAFLDSDDQWLPHKLQTQDQFIKQHPNYSIVHGNESWYRDGQTLKQLKKHKKSGGRIYSQCVPLCVISPSTVCLKKDLFIDHGGFKEHFPVCEDYDLWLRICAVEDVGFIESPLINKFGGHSDQLSRRYHSMDYWRIQSLKEMINHPKLNSQEKDLTLKTLIQKSSILLKGYKKHQNLEHFEEVQQILSWSQKEWAKSLS